MIGIAIAVTVFALWLACVVPNYRSAYVAVYEAHNARWNGRDNDSYNTHAIRHSRGVQMGLAAALGGPLYFLPALLVARATPIPPSRQAALLQEAQADIVRLEMELEMMDRG